MVKNLHGGTGTKSLARKHQVKHKNDHIRLPECEEEQFAYVEKMLGNGMCEVYTNDNMRLIGHIRNKFRGRQKRHNTITKGMILLIGLRTWESTSKNCDVLTIYDDNDIKQIKNKPDICIDNIIKMQLSHTFVDTSNKDEEHFEFTTAQDDEDEEEIKNENITSKFTIDVEEEIELDDI
jgi:initiation factor 1A